jgi:hypothetical protein
MGMGLSYLGLSYQFILDLEKIGTNLQMRIEAINCADLHLYGKFATSYGVEAGLCQILDGFYQARMNFSISMLVSESTVAMLQSITATWRPKSHRTGNAAMHFPQ